MKVLLAPDKFAGTIAAERAAQALATGWRSCRADDEILLRPMSDGGPGFCAVIAAALTGARTVPVMARDPLGRPVPAHVVLARAAGDAGETAYVESAQAAGLHLLSAADRDPERTTTSGVADLLEAALNAGARRIVVGLGGSATNDGGRGVVQELERRPQLLVALRRVSLVLATDVDNPLLGLQGASAVFGPQKGADREAVARLEGRMQAWVRERPDIAAVADVPGAGAAGGLGAALLAMGGTRTSGAAIVADAIGLAAAAEDAALVVTGEGTYDSTSLRGKVVATVAAIAQSAAVPCVVVAGQVQVGGREAAAHGVDEMLALSDLAGSVQAAMADASSWLEQAGARLARRWGGRNADE